MNDNQESPTLNFEQSLLKLEAAVNELEEGQLGLSDALARYEESVKHLKRCYQLLEGAEQKIELLTGVEEDGTDRTEPFADAGEQAAASPGQRRKQRTRQAASQRGAESSVNGDVDG